MRKRSIIQMTLVGVAVGAALAVVAVFIPWLPDAASEQAGIVDSVYWVVTIICVVIFALVAGVSVYAVYKFRAPPGDMDDGSPIHGHTGIEIVWTLIPTILVTAIAIYSGVALAQAEDVPSDHRVIAVTGEQFAWTFTYPDIEVEGGRPLTTGELVVPVDQTVEFEITSKDVIHSFWVPEWRMKQDAVQGVTTRTVVKPTKIGEYDVVCTELCGLGHATMRSRARVLSMADFQAWVEEQQRLAREGGAVQGKELFTQQCGSCHTLADAGTTGEVGPDLDEALQGVDADFVMESIVDPSASIAEGYEDAMPDNFGEVFTEPQLEGLVEYLLQATGGGN
ncbi:MAG TPA: cytochrome c oxidase subunit II [Gaiellaceae bacterium]|nr:cytochrome c oxidase subunit II [Gaiellaceae bacterium]